MKVWVQSLILGLAAQGASADELKAAFFSTEFLSQVSALRDHALHDQLAYQLTESLTTEVGSRLAGSAGDAKAVAWGKAKFEALGFDRVTLEPVTFDRWTRGVETAEVMAPFAEAAIVKALSNLPRHIKKRYG